MSRMDNSNLCESIEENDRAPLLSAYAEPSLQNERMREGNPVIIGVPSTVLEPPNAYRSRWISIKILYATTFLSSMSFSVNAGSLWPYLQEMDNLSTPTVLGLVVAVYSLGQLVASLLLGLWTNRRRCHKEPILFTLLVGMVGNLCYSYVQDIPSGRQYALMVSRLILGIYAANVAVVRAYTSNSTTLKERTSAFAWLSAGQALGFIVGPGLQTACAPIGYPGPVSSPFIYLNMYTLPTLFSCVCIVVNAVAVLGWFTEFCVHSDNYTPGGYRSDPYMKPDYVAVGSCLFMFFTILSVFCLGETSLSPLGMDMYSWTREEATIYTGVVMMTSGILAVAVFLSVKPLSKYISEKKLLVLSHIFLLLGLFCYIPWGNERPNIRIIDLAKNESFLFGPMSVPDFVAYVAVHPTNSSLEPRGCNVLVQKWCQFTPKLHLAQYLGGQVFVMLGYPSSFVIINSLYSKLLPPVRQGTMMGVLTSAGCLARLIGPGLVGSLYTSYGPWPTYTSGMAIILVSLVTYILTYKRIKPFSAPLRRHCGHSYDSLAHT